VELNFALMADYASISQEQKLSINGIFQSINALQFPFTQPSLYLVVQIKASSAEYGQPFKFQVKLLDEASLSITEVSTRATIPRPARSGKSVFVNHIVQFTSLIFPKPGPYQFVILGDSDQKGDLELEVNQVAP